MGSAREVVDRTWTVDDENADLYAAIDTLRKEKAHMDYIWQSQTMAYENQKRIQGSNPMQLKMVENSRTFAIQNRNRTLGEYDSKIDVLQRILDEKKVRDHEILEKAVEEVQLDVTNLKIETSSLAGQINILKQEAAQRKKEFDSKLNEIRSEAKDQKEWNEEVYAKIYALQADSQLLMSEYEEKQRDLREKQYIDSDPNTAAFYGRIFSKINETFVASKAIQSGMIDRAKYSKGDQAASYIELLGSMIPLPGAGAVLGYISQGVAYLSDRREGERINNITSNALGFSEMDEICDWIARGLLFAYEEQISVLTTDAAGTFAECCVGYILEFLASTESDRTIAIDQTRPTIVHHVDAETASISSTGIIPSVAQDPMSAMSPREQMVSDLLVYMSNRRGVRNGKYGLSNVALDTRVPGLQWTDRGIIKQTGLRTITGSLFHGAPPAPKEAKLRARQAAMVKQTSQSSPNLEAPGNGAPLDGSPTAELPKPPALKKSPSVGSRLFRWGSPKEQIKAAQEVVQSVTELKGKAGDAALKLSFKAAGRIDDLLAADEMSRPDVYGYRLGTHREAVLLGMVEVASRVPSKVLPLSAERLARDPKAMAKFWQGI
ncbi:hypothetical protein HDU77_008467 [Chytriomyces hyalinus]|nr:hypothetical protein HDU77_008467 [Chytriomyces hyalinus]